MGVINPKRASFPGNVIGLLIKPLVFGNDKPMRRNSPSAPELFTADPTQCEFERERDQLIKAIDRFVSIGEACCSRHPHTLFAEVAIDESVELAHEANNCSLLSKILHLW